MDTTPTLLPVGPMARRLRVPVKWLREEADAGRLPCVRAGRAYLFDPETVEAILLERARGPAQPSPPPAPDAGQQNRGAK